MADMIKVRSASDATVVVSSPSTMMNKTWTKRNSFHLIPRDTLLQTYYNSCLEKLVNKGILVIEDKEFLREVGLLEDEETSVVFELSEAIMGKCISTMPLWELKQTLEKLSEHQINDLTAYAVKHFADLKMDRIEMLNKASGKNILKAIELHKAAQED